MKKHIKTTVIIAMLFGFVLSISACGNAGESTEIANTTVSEVEQSEEIETKTDTPKKQNNSAKEANGTVLLAGNYIIGEDLLEGKYSFHVTSGYGKFMLFDSYEDYKTDDYDYFLRFDVAAEDVDFMDYATNYIANLRLQNGECLVISDSAVVECSGTIEDFGIEGMLVPGCYIIGEDFLYEKASFAVEDGYGKFMIFTSYDDFVEDDYSYIERYDVAASNVDFMDYATSIINNVRFENGECIIISDSAKLSYGEEAYISSIDSENTSQSNKEKQFSESTEEESIKKEETGAVPESDGIRPEIKEVIDSYEGIVDEYVAFMEKYSSTDDVLSLMDDYTEYVSKLADFTEQFESLEDEDLNDAEMKYYAEVALRVEKKLIDVL